jgi:transposase
VDGGRQSWLQVADVLGVSARTVRRLRWRYQHYWYDGLFDRRRRVPSARRVPLEELQRILQRYHERYEGFNVRHFYQIAQREYEVTICYTLVKRALQGAGLVAKRRARGRHRRRREPRPCFRGTRASGWQSLCLARLGARDAADLARRRR